MPERPPRDFHPRLERMEPKQPLSASPATALNADADAGVGVAPVAPVTLGTPLMLADNQTGLFVTTASQSPRFKPTGIKLDRVTNPRVVNGVSNASLTPPYGHVLVQRQLPVPGQTYNLLFLSVYNATGKTITASDNYTVRTTNTAKGVSFPILQGNQVWPAGGRIVFYIMTNSYYKLESVPDGRLHLQLPRPVDSARERDPRPVGDRREDQVQPRHDRPHPRLLRHLRTRVRSAINLESPTRRSSISSRSRSRPFTSDRSTMTAGHVDRVISQRAT